jgi:hypothetical protein
MSVVDLFRRFRKDPEDLGSVLHETREAVANREKDSSWAKVLADLCEQHQMLMEGNASPQERYSFARSIQGIYGAMGSFNDNLYSDVTRRLQATLYSKAEEELRSCWKLLGKPWHNIPEGEVFCRDEHVTLVAGQIISLGRDESERRAPHSPLVYLVEERIANDVDNMPRYRIKADSHVWNARHGALVRAAPPNKSLERTREG